MPLRSYDGFGNHMSPGRPSSQGGSFAWRGAEGSVYDSHPTLVYMQARHYDPTIGRFIQPDTLALASMTTQGMNKYIYCENDPVSFSDPNGRFFWLAMGAFILGFAAGGYIGSSIFEHGDFQDFLPGEIFDYISTVLGINVALGCTLQFETGMATISALLTAELISMKVFLNLMTRMFFGWLAISFLAGFAAGLAIASLLYTAVDTNEDDSLMDDEKRSEDRHFAAAIYLV